MGTATAIGFAIFGSFAVGLFGGFMFGWMLGESRGYSRAMRQVDPDYRVKQWRKRGTICIAIGGLFLLVGLAASVYMWHFTRMALHTSGTVVDLLQRKDKDGDVTYAPTFIFKDKNGGQHTVTSSTSESPPEFHIGDNVQVLYLGNDPQTARIDTFGETWELPSAAGICGGVVFVVGWVLFWWPRIFRSFKGQQPNPIAT